MFKQYSQRQRRDSRVCLQIAICLHGLTEIAGLGVDSPQIINRWTGISQTNSTRWKLRDRKITDRLPE